MPETTDGRVLRAQALKRETRAQLIAAARRVFGRDGYHGASIKAILVEAGVARGTFYAHFDSKQAAFGAVLQGFVAKLAAAIQPVDVTSEVALRDQLVANFTRVLTLLEEDAELTRLLLQQAPGLGPEAEAPVKAFYAGARALIVRSIRAGTAMGLVRDGDVELRAIFAMGAIKEAVIDVLIGGNTSREVVVQELLSYLLRGFMK